MNKPSFDFQSVKYTWTRGNVGYIGRVGTWARWARHLADSKKTIIMNIFKK